MNQRQASIRWGSLFGLLLAAGSAHARSRTVELSLRAPSECESAENIEANVDELVRRANGEPLLASLSISRSAQGYFATLQTPGAKPRRLSAPSCEAVVEAVTVILALAIDPQANARVRRSRNPTHKAAGAPGASGARLVRFEAGAASAFDTGALPHVALGASVRAGVWAPRWSVASVATFWLPASRSLPSDPGVGGRFTWWTIAISGCAGLATRPQLSLCLEPEMGRLEGSGSGTEDNRSVGATWLALSAVPDVGVDITRRVRFRAGLGPAFTVLGRHAFVLERSGENLEVHQPARVSLRGRFGLDVLF